jgi:hypothetical protein
MAARSRSYDERVSVSFGHGFRASRKPSCTPGAKFRPVKLLGPLALRVRVAGYPVPAPASFDPI